GNAALLIAGPNHTSFHFRPGCGSTPSTDRSNHEVRRGAWWASGLSSVGVQGTQAAGTSSIQHQPLLADTISGGSPGHGDQKANRPKRGDQRHLRCCAKQTETDSAV